MVFVIALFGAIALVLAGAVSGGHSRNLDALLVIAGGSVLGYGIIWLRKRRERATRPPWMGMTTEWEKDG
jgi:drug/metabolite transporter (DMT)-like permease